MCIKKIISQALQRGNEAHKTGKVEQAKYHYEAVLKVQPDHSDANHSMGLLFAEVGNAEKALSFFKTALEANPRVAKFWLSYINTLVQVKRLDEAKELFDKAKKRGAEGKAFNLLEKKLFPSLNYVKKTSKNQNPSQAQLEPLVTLHKKGKFKKALNQTIELQKNSPILLYLVIYVE